MKNNFLAIVCMTLWLSVAVYGQDTQDVVTLDYAYTVEANGSVSDVFWCPNESCFAVVSKHLRDSDSLLIFDTGTGDLLQTFSLEEELAPLDSLKFNHDTSLLLGTLSDINSVKLWKVSSGESVSVINPDNTEVAHSYFNPFAAQVVILVRNPETRQITTIVWDIETSEIVKSFDSEALPINSSEWLIIGDEQFSIQNENNEVVVEQHFSGMEHFYIDEHTKNILVLTPNADLQNSILHVWDTTNHMITEITVPYKAEPFFELGWLSPTNVYLGEYNHIAIWDTTTSELIAELNLEEDEEFADYWQWNAFNNAIAFESYAPDTDIHTFSVWDLDERTVTDLYSYTYDEIFEMPKMTWRPHTYQLVFSFADRVEIFDNNTGESVYLLDLREEIKPVEECCQFEIDEILWNEAGNVVLVWGVWGGGLLYAWNIPQN